MRIGRKREKLSAACEKSRGWSAVEHQLQTSFRRPRPGKTIFATGVAANHANENTNENYAGLESKAFFGINDNLAIELLFSFKP
ncbi:MAG: hypothetical protein AB7J13_11440 [Pyrinomonadaceae bacterium]